MDLYVQQVQTHHPHIHPDFPLQGIPGTTVPFDEADADGTTASRHCPGDCTCAGISYDSSSEQCCDESIICTLTETCVSASTSTSGDAYCGE
jgi:hypothetical protein